MNPPCSKCGGPHPFDTVVPSVRWNAVIRANHYPDYLCLTCIVNAFVLANESFTATLWGGFFNGMAIEVRVNEQPAIDADAISQENTGLRAQISQLVATQASPPTPESVWIEERLRKEWLLGHGCPFAAFYLDDGEMQCNAPLCRKDFKRAPLDELRQHVERRRIALAVQAGGSLHLSALRPASSLSDTT